jgi:hypothetical protein
LPVHDVLAPEQAHLPLWHVPLQQSPFVAQVALVEPQTHFPVEPQAPLQQSDPALHTPPTELHAQRPLLQLPPQQSAAVRQVELG